MTVKGTKFRFTFHHYLGEIYWPKEYPSSEPRDMMACMVRVLDGTDVGRRPLGCAIRNPRDPFDPRKARKVALADALKELGWDKRARQAAWDAFFAASPKHKASRR